MRLWPNTAASAGSATGHCSRVPSPARKTLASYGTNPSIFEFAAAYCVGIAKNHPFVDGNERAGYQAAVVFLELNGYLATPPQVEIVDTMLRVAQGQAAERDVAQWLSHHSKRPTPDT